jgi:hypothetical protein
MTSLPPWVNGPFELLIHAESHLQRGEDFDRRIALISYDNAIEVAITTYLTLNPIQRGGRTYQKIDVDKWLNSYHTKLEFLDHELAARGISWKVDKTYIIWAHDHRNEQYHGGQKGTPEKGVLKIIREAALWIFSFLFDIADVEVLFSEAIAASSPPAPPQQVKAYDRAIDREYGVITVGEQSYYASELLFTVDYAAYRELGDRLSTSGVSSQDEEDRI